MWHIANIQSMVAAVILDRFFPDRIRTQLKNVFLQGLQAKL